MADTSDFRNGLIIRFKNDPFVIVEFQHVKPGKGGAFVRSTLKNLKTGKVLDNTFRSGESVDVIRVDRKKFQYLYREGDFLRSFILSDEVDHDRITARLNNGVLEVELPRAATARPRRIHVTTD